MQCGEKGNRICKRVCIRIEGELTSPLLVGSGEDQLTDMDVILDARGEPFVPGSSLAGALRHYLVETYGDNQAATYLLGSIEEQSRLFVYDVKLMETKLCHRDGVKLDVYKTAEEAGKYEMQIVERGAKYVMRLELILRENDFINSSGTTISADSVMQLIQQLMIGLNTGEITLGAKSRRGFGKLAVNHVFEKRFTMTNSEEYLAWLDWNWDQVDAFSDADRWDIKQMIDTMKPRDHCLRIPLKVRQSIIVRRYAEKSFGAINFPDYEQLESAGEGVIPGTSWMGAIRGRLRMILQSLGIDTDYLHAKLETIFGTWTDNQQPNQSLIASLVRVEESVIQGGHSLPITRNAIDRFTGGTVSGALYTSVPWVGGQTELILRWPRNLTKVTSEVICGLLLWVVADLQNGLLAVGGETAVGRGTFIKNGEITLDGEPITLLAPYYQAALYWCKNSTTKKGDENEYSAD